MKIKTALVFLGLSVLLAMGSVQYAQAVPTGRTDVVEIYAGQKIGMSVEGGLLVALTNGEGASVSKGYLVRPTSTDGAFGLTSVDDDDILGIVYDTTCASGATCWIAVDGIADVYFGTTSTANHIARMSNSGDSGAGKGKATSEPYPTPPFAVDKHFQEIGHVIESGAANALHKVVLHFN